MRLIVGLTGGIGSGKSTVANMFAELGAAIVDTDLIARKVVQPGTDALSKIKHHFGTQVIEESGALNRRALRQLVFSDDHARHWLESLLHPLIEQETLQQLADYQGTYCLLVSPLLLETQQTTLVEKIIVVDVSIETQLTRTTARDGSDTEQVQSIINAQIERSQRLAAADYIIDNDHTLEALNKQVRAIDTALRNLAESTR